MKMPQPKMNRCTAFLISRCEMAMAVLKPCPKIGINILMAALILAAVAINAQADPPQRPVFRNHIVPLLTRLGCNKAACHGAADGQAGFHLSLFGYDLKGDHEALLSGDPNPRANWRDPEASLILQKPCGFEDHEGGVLFEPESFEYQVLLNWVKNRAPGIPLGTDWIEVKSLDVQPAIVRGLPSDKPLKLSVQAEWNNKTSDDVTQFCRFVSKDETIATVGPTGQITLHKPGMTHVLIYYDRVIQPVEVIVPFTNTASSAGPAPTGAGSIDTAVDRQLAQLGLQPAELCSDAEFLRRVSLDLTGRLPRSDEVLEFIDDKAVDKRERKIDALIASDAYTDHWTAWLCELFGLNEEVMPDGAFRREEALLSYQWVRRRVEQGTSYDQLVNDLVRGINRRPEQPFEEYIDETNAYFRAGGEDLLVKQDRLPFFWGRKHIRAASNKALTFSHTFLAVKLQCAECHKHPFDRWTKEDFEGLEAFFEPFKFGTPPQDVAASKRIRDTFRPKKGTINDHFIRQAFDAGKRVSFPGVYLKDADDSPKAPQVDRLKVLTDWMNDRDHPYLAIALVNRVWEHFLGTGIVDTPDDLSIGNPPSNRELLDQLVLRFIESDYRLRTLHREIVMSRAYQRSSTLKDAVPEHRRQFAQSQFRPLSAEVLHDAVFQATADDETQLTTTETMVGPLSVLRNTHRLRKLLARMGQPPGDEVCARVRSNNPTLPRTLELYNGPTFRKLLDRPNGWVGRMRRTGTDAAAQQLRTPDELLPKLIDAAFLRTVSRLPSTEERSSCLSYCQESKSLPDGVRDVLWALINSREFLLNH